MNRFKSSYIVLGMALMIPFITSCQEDNPGINDPNGNKEKPLTAYNKPARNPYLAQETYSITHFNSAQTDAFPYSVIDGVYKVNPDECVSTWSGPVNLMTIASAAEGYMWGMSSDRVSYIKISNNGFERIAEAELPGVTKHSKEELDVFVANYKSVEELEVAVKKVLGDNPQMEIASGNYVLCDKDNYAYTNAGRSLARYRLINENNPSQGIILDKVIDMTPYIFGSFTIVGVSMSYDGYLIVASQKGLVAVERDLSSVRGVYQFPDELFLTNSIANDEAGGVYVACNSTEENGKGTMYKLICRNGEFSDKETDGAWKANYDGGPIAPAIKHGYGSGSTPTLMGFGDEEDKLVVITDGAKRMKLVAFWRDAIPADAIPVDATNPRLADQFEVSCGLPVGTEWIQSEQSVVAGGYDAFVVNNIHPDMSNSSIEDKIIGVLAIGPHVSAPTGAECVRWNTTKNCWESKWTRGDVSSISMIPSVSIPSEMVFVNGYDGEGWNVTGMDWKTGATRHRVVFGENNRGNGAYAIIQYFPNGDLLFNSIAGPFRVELK